MKDAINAVPLERVSIAVGLAKSSWRDVKDQLKLRARLLDSPEEEMMFWMVIVACASGTASAKVHNVTGESRDEAGTFIVNTLTNVPAMQALLKKIDD